MQYVVKLNQITVRRLSEGVYSGNCAKIYVSGNTCKSHVLRGLGQIVRQDSSIIPRNGRNSDERLNGGKSVDA